MSTWTPSADRFPRLLQDGARKTSEESARYNCIAWAAGKDDRLWWPVPQDTPLVPEVHWPTKDVGDADTLDVFQRAFSTMGYAVCPDGNTDFEHGVEKVAIYVLNGEVTHMSRQIPTGKWLSKLGRSPDDPDIEHATPSGVEGPFYGQLACIMKRTACACSYVLPPGFA